MLVAVYGGSFNPPHLGHQLACATVLAAARPSVDEVWMVPAFAHAFGKPLAPFADRLAMCETVARLFGGRVRVSRVEEELGGPSYTLRTLEALEARHPAMGFVLVIGADLLDERPRWHRWPELAARARFLVLGRSGAEAVAGDRGAQDTRIPIDLPEVSSTEARRRLAAGEDTAGLLDEEVRRQALAAGLYRA